MEQKQAIIQNQRKNVNSPVIQIPFVESNSGIEAHYYRLSALFGLLSPHKFVPPNPGLFEYLEDITMSKEKIREIQEFQDVFWRLMTSTYNTQATSKSDVNFLIVPLKETSIDYTLISAVLNRQEIPPSDDCLYISSTNSLWRILHKITSTTPSNSFLTHLIGINHGKLSEYIAKYADLTAFDLIFNEDFNISSVKQLRSWIVSNKFEVQDNETVYMATQIKPVRGSQESRSNQKFPKGTPLFLFGCLKPHCLTTQYLSESHKLIQKLVQIENYSYISDFSYTFSYSSSFEYLQQALTAPIMQFSTDYNPLETIGDSVLKLGSSLHLYLKYPSFDENKLTKRRNFIVSNKNLAQISDSFELIKYLHSKELRVTQYRPPFFTGHILNESSSVSYLTSTKMKADVLESIIGAFYLGHGFCTAFSFINKLKVLDTLGVNPFVSIDGNMCVVERSHLDMYDFPLGTPLTHLLGVFELKESDKLDDLVDYRFRNPEILYQALTHKTYSTMNYERLEYIGDAVLDLIVLTNIYSLNDSLSSAELTFIKMNIVKNSTLGKFAILMGLHRFIKGSDVVANCISNTVQCIDWNENLCEFDKWKEGKLLGDVFESLVGAILVDSRNLYVTFMVVGNWLKQVFVYMVQNIDELYAKYNKIGEEKKISNETERETSLEQNVELKTQKNKLD